MTKPTFQFSIEGSGVIPESVKLRDLYEALALVESALVETAKHMGCKDADDLSISLVGISDGSTRITVATTPTMLRAASVVTKAIAENEFGATPVTAQSSLRKLWSKASTKTWSFRFTPIANGVTEALVSAQHEILRPGKISGITTLFGKAIGVGGKGKPTVRLTLPSGEGFTAQLLDKEMARELGSRLYEWVALEGEAKWNADDWVLDSFRATKITEYVDTDAVTAFNNLAVAVGDAWDNIDPDEYIREMRAD